MPYKKLKDAPDSLKVALGNDLSKINKWAEFFDAIKATGKTDSSAARLAWLSFKKLYKKVNGKWIKRD